MKYVLIVVASMLVGATVDRALVNRAMTEARIQNFLDRENAMQQLADCRRENQP